MKTRLAVLLFIISTASATYAQNAARGNFSENSVLADGAWYKIATVQQGVYKLTYDNLKQLGVSEPFSSQNFRLYGNGGAMLPEKNASSRYDDLIENAVQVYDGGDGLIDQGDYVLFYGQSSVKWNYNPILHNFEHQQHYYSDTVFYFISFDKGPGKRIVQYPEIIDAPGLSVNKYNEHLYHEQELRNLLKSGKIWLGESFDENTQQFFNFIFTGISHDDMAKVRVSFTARSMAKSALTVETSGISRCDSINQIPSSSNAEYAKSLVSSLSFLPDSDTLTVKITYHKTDSTALSWLNYIEAEALRNLVYNGEQFVFHNIQTIGIPVSEFVIAAGNNPVKIWNISDFINIMEMPLTIQGAEASFRAYTDSLTAYIAFDSNNLLAPVLIGSVANQNLHGLPQANMLIISHSDFLDEAAVLAAFHNNNGMSVNITRVDQVYNEFSSGSQDVTALRDFIRMFYERETDDSANSLKYVLLFGDGSYDMKNRLANNTNIIPTWQTLNSLVPTGSYVSDDFFGMLDPAEGENLSGKLDIGIGRFPVVNSLQAATVVEKCIRYGTRQNLVNHEPGDGQISNYDPWRNNVLIVADDEDANLHFKQAEKLVQAIDSLDKNINFTKVYLDAYKQVSTPFGVKFPDANEAINSRIEQGTLMFNYFGHGGEAGLAAENIVTLAEIGQYTNFYNLPVFVTATCEFSRFDNPEYFSAGEHLLLSEKGGGIALFSTTRVAYAHSNEVLSQNLIKSTFINSAEEKVRFGDMIKNAKNSCPAGIYMQNFTLLGDPALEFAIPEYEIVTDEVISDTLLSAGDTIHNCRTLTIKGHISDAAGNVLEGFNGTLFPFVYDKPYRCFTLANDAQYSYSAPFLVQNTVLYKGNISVVNGLFEFTFFVPKNISFGSGYGKISYYARDQWDDARGVLDSLFLLNSGNNADTDILGPDISAWLEDANFKDGDYTSANPPLFLNFHDTSGINCYGLGFGKEITLILDDDEHNPVFLNDVYIPDMNTYTSGSIEYQLNNLSYGPHKLLIRASDLLDNTSEKEVRFDVLTPEDIRVGGVYNYPDPVNAYTCFHIEHNLSIDAMEYTITVYDIAGRKAAELSGTVPPAYYKPLEICWDAVSLKGEPLQKGFYSYQVVLTDAAGRKRQAADKMIIIK